MVRRKTKQVNIGPLLVRTANQSKELLSEFPELQSFAAGDVLVTVTCERAVEASESLRQWALDLTRANMQSLYEASHWGWSENAKKKELGHRDAWYLVARDQAGKPVGFVHFRFDMDFDLAVLYCYELQLEPEVQRRGLGSFLMHALDVLAQRFRMCKLLLTVFVGNEGALAFYRGALGYRTDCTSPGNGADYLILSKPTSVPSRR
ncbi:unnamed protein product [Ixodes persulcatus]